MTLLGKVRARRLQSALEGYAAQSASSGGDLDAAQLDALNRAWRESLAVSPWARSLRDRLSAPDRFESWQEVAALVPAQRKADLRATLVSADGATRVQWRTTGGTTAEPIRFPVLESEPGVALLDQWLGRQRLGVAPHDPLFLLWGHAQMFGVGIRGVVARTKRRLTDLALGYTRWSAYRLSDADLALARRALIRSRARYVIGYSSALDRLARASLAHANEIHELGLKVVIATAEGFPRPDSREVISRCFGCPVAMEYGSVETGLLAYERLAGGYNVSWAHQRLELAPPDAAGRRELLVTSLYARALPLLRYAIGDWVEPFDATTDIRTEFRAVVGRSNDLVLTRSGLWVHSETFTHAVRDLPGLLRYQVVCAENGLAATISYEAAAPLPEAALAEVRRRLALIEPDLAEIPIVRVERLSQSVAGKNPMVVRKGRAC